MLTWIQRLLIYHHQTNTQELAEKTPPIFQQWTSLAASIALLWLLCFVDGNVVLEVRLLFHALTKAVCHLYLALLLMRRACSHFVDCARHLITHAQQGAPPTSHGYLQQGPTPAKKGTLHFLEGICVVCETVLNLIGAALNVCAAVCHALQGVLYVLAATLRTIQINLFSQMNVENERWDKERHRVKDNKKKLNCKVVEYISAFCQDRSPLRIKVDMPPVYR